MQRVERREVRRLLPLLRLGGVALRAGIGPQYFRRVAAHEPDIRLVAARKLTPAGYRCGQCE
jgi:hypothetical protein